MNTMPEFAWHGGGLGQHRGRHVGVAARRMNERAPIRVGVLQTPRPLLRRCLAVRARHPVHDEAQRLPAHMGVDRLDDVNHSAGIRV